MFVALKKMNLELGQDHTVDGFECQTKEFGFYLIGNMMSLKGSEQ